MIASPRVAHRLTGPGPRFVRATTVRERCGAGRSLTVAARFAAAAARRAFLLVVLLAGGPSLAADQAPLILTQQKGPAEARLKGARPGRDGPEIRLADELSLTLQVEGQPPLDVALPPKIVHSDAWKASPAGPAVTEPLPDGRVRWRQTFVLEPLHKGSLPLPLEPLPYRGGTAEWKPWSVRVTSEVARPELGEAHDITPIEDVPPVPSWRDWLVLLVAWPVASILIVGVLLWRLRRRRLPHVLPLPPGAAALRELERLAAVGLVSAADVRRYYAQLSDVVRRYLEARFQLPASRQTTAEFLESVRQSPLLAADLQALLRDFLERCDRAKFAPVTPAPAECEAAAELARRFVQETEAAAQRSCVTAGRSGQAP
jgi:hypothetical protein